MSSENKMDKQLERMLYLMEYKTPKTSQKKTNIEYTTVGADGKAYGILREGNMYYIKTSTPEQKLVKESYEYINGYNYRNENGYKSYNEATKHLELKLMKLNEQFGKHEDVSVVDHKKGEKDMKILTEEARKELDHIHQVLENSTRIGMGNVGDPEGKASASDPTKQGEPFETEAEAILDKDLKKETTVKNSTPDNKEVKGVETDLTCDKNKKGTDSVKKDSKDAHSDIEGTNVAEQKPKGGKAVKVNEGVVDAVGDVVGGVGDAVDDILGEEGADFSEDDLDYMGDDEVRNLAEPELPGEVTDIEELDDDMTDEDDEEDGLVGFDDPSDELESLMNEIFDVNTQVAPNMPTSMNPDVNILESPEFNVNNTGDSTATRTDNDGGSDMPLVNEDDTIDECGDLEQISESINRIANIVAEKLTVSKKSKLEEKIERMVNEEMHHLNAWGKHPRYQNPAFKTPENKEVIVNQGDRDWDDDSAKGNEPYGKKIGSSAPFDQVVKMLTDSVVKKLQESLTTKKN